MLILKVLAVKKSYSLPISEKSCVTNLEMEENAFFMTVKISKNHFSDKVLMSFETFIGEPPNTLKLI